MPTMRGMQLVLVGLLLGAEGWDGMQKVCVNTPCLFGAHKDICDLWQDLLFAVVFFQREGLYLLDRTSRGDFYSFYELDRGNLLLLVV